MTSLPNSSIDATTTSVGSVLVVGLKQLVDADVDPLLDGLGAVVGVADDDHADLGRLLQLVDASARG